jgi:hypothetical protein
MLKDCLCFSGKRRLILLRCRDCRIPFLTSPSNRRRKDIRCPFGCRERHRRDASHKRSRAYYQSTKGKARKRFLNQRRYKRRPKDKSQMLRPPLGHKLLWREPFLRHVRFVVCVIEGKRMTITETEDLIVSLLKKWRQHSLPTWQKRGKIPDR